ncbi:hypothetical protein FNV43_RR20634 [Rhamnella rubrinervis]|uniref:peptidyl-tRNA hydrolase n=2 Tax=Magnoliopsida TaxID=3398 RepID=A0A8K0GUR8_9ROSA|nr:hypothetical protein FNV43_RR20634 [Rhamnella rubrinervis]
MSQMSPSAGNTPPVEPKQPWLVVGLGNPGKKYQGTRHNVGFEMVDAIAEAEGINISCVSFKSLYGNGFIGDVPIILAKPQTFMNSSGESVGAIAKYYKIPLKQVLVIFDDLDLPFARLKLLPKGGHGGHNGMRSVIDHFKGSRDFPRLRIGIGRPPGKMDPVNFVLRPFTKQEREELNFSFQHGVEALRLLLLKGPESGNRVMVVPESTMTLLETQSTVALRILSTPDSQLLTVLRITSKQLVCRIAWPDLHAMLIREIYPALPILLPDKIGVEKPSGLISDSFTLASIGYNNKDTEPEDEKYKFERSVMFFLLEGFEGLEVKGENLMSLLQRR